MNAYMFQYKQKGGGKYYRGVPQEYPPLPQNIKLGHFYLSLGQNNLIDEVNKPIDEQKHLMSHQKMLSIEQNNLIVEHFLSVDEVFYLVDEVKYLDNDWFEGGIQKLIIRNCGFNFFYSFEEK